MSDQELRELARRWEESGSSEDEGALLRARVRVGALAHSRVLLAAYCGHEGAARVVGAPKRLRSLLPWVEGLYAQDPLAPVRAAVAAARFVYPVYGGRLTPELKEGEWVTDALRSAERWVLHPQEASTAKARQRFEWVEDAIFESSLRGRESAAATCCGAAALAAGGGGLKAVVSALRAATKAKREPWVRDFVEEELIQWALGADPLVRCPS